MTKCLLDWITYSRDDDSDDRRPLVLLIISCYLGINILIYYIWSIIKHFYRNITYVKCIFTYLYRSRNCIRRNTDDNTWKLRFMQITNWNEERNTLKLYRIRYTSATVVLIKYNQHVSRKYASSFKKLCTTQYWNWITAFHANEKFKRRIKQFEITRNDESCSDNNFVPIYKYKSRSYEQFYTARYWN